MAGTGSDINDLDAELFLDRLDKIIDLLTVCAYGEQTTTCPKCRRGDGLVDYQNEKNQNRLLCTHCNYRFSPLVECPQKSSA